MPVRLIESLGTTEPIAEIFSDQSVLQAMVDFEAALARVQARLGLIPGGTAEAIEKAAQAGSFDIAALCRDTLRAGTPGIPLVKALSARVHALDPVAARFVHWGATSQDVADTALVLLLKRARAVLATDHARLKAALRKLSDRHADTVMLARTLLQPAPPVTFGLKAAGWLVATARGWIRIDTRFAEALAVQFGGASGTLAALGEHGIQVGQALAEQLGLAYPEAPWHAHRDRLAALVAACGVQCGSLGKMARDIALLMQSEVGEVSEAAGEGRGGSSTMPHKRNPIACSLALAAAQRAPNLVSAFLTSMVQEHERGVGGWHAEWPSITGIVKATGVAVISMAEAAEGLVIDEGRMRANLEATRGVVFAERVRIMLAATLDRDTAHHLLEEASRKSLLEGRRLMDVLAGMAEVTRVIPVLTLRELDTPEQYLGAAHELRARLIAAAEK